jgi:SPP1 family predicted phage head-tail adaptor
MARAGQYRDLIVVQRETDAGGEDKHGNPADAAWQPLQPISQFWGNLRETPGKERMAAGRVEAPATATLRLRHSSESIAITAADRILARGHIWAIKGAPIDPSGRRQEIEFTLERGGAVE